MALTALDYFKPLRNLGGGCIPTMSVACESAETWSQGDLVVSAAGYAVKGADDPALATILGVALEDVAAGDLSGLIVPALPNVTFWGRIATGDAGATVNSAVTDRYTSGEGAGFDISLATVFYINVGDTANAPVTIIRLIDDAGTAWGAVEFIFASSAFNAVT